MHPGGERTTKRAKNKQDRPAMTGTKDNPSKDEDRKPAAKKNTPTPDGVPSTYPGFKRESTSTRNRTRPGSVVCTSGDGIKREPVSKVETFISNSECGQEATENAANDIEPVVSVFASAQGIKREPVINDETIPAPASSSASEEGIKREPSASAQEIKREASIPTETVVAINAPNLNRAFTMRRKVAKRTNPLYLAPPSPPPENTAAPLSPSPQAEEIPARKKPRHEEPLLALRRSFRLNLDTPFPTHPTDTVVASALRRSSRRVIPSSSTGTSTPPPYATVVVPTGRRSRLQIQLPRIETSEVQSDDGDSNDNDGDLLGSSWEYHLSELAEYRKIHRNCNVPFYYSSENTKLGVWLSRQRTQYRLHREGKISHMTSFRIHALESLDVEWNCLEAAWEFRLSELADYNKTHGHCNVPNCYSENCKLAHWVARQRKQYNLHVKGKTSSMTLSRIQELESLGFEWDSQGAAWEDRLSELADYHKINGHCNVPKRYSENIKLGIWVRTQRNQYKLHREGKTSSMTLSRIQELETLGFEWSSFGAVWEDRLSELADYRKIHGHCNVPSCYSENSKLGMWVSRQRYNYNLHVKGKKSPMTPYRIQSLKKLGF